MAARRKPIDALRVYVHQNAYARIPNFDTRHRLSTEKYKKGWEVRVIVTGADVAEEVRELARKAGFRPGRPFAKGRQWAVPIYGAEAVDAFSEELGVDAYWTPPTA